MTPAVHKQRAPAVRTWHECVASSDLLGRGQHIIFLTTHSGFKSGQFSFKRGVESTVSHQYYDRQPIKRS